jgi:hypothetical protein
MEKSSRSEETKKSIFLLLLMPQLSDKSSSWA